MKNYILIDDIPRSSVVGVLASLLRHMKIDPLEILLWNSKHDDSKDESRIVEVPPEVLRAIAERRGEDEA